MVIRQIKTSHWEYVYRQITTHGRAAPLSLQLDIDINCNGVEYIMANERLRHYRRWRYTTTAARAAKIII